MEREEWEVACAAERDNEYGDGDEQEVGKRRQGANEG